MQSPASSPGCKKSKSNWRHTCLSHIPIAYLHTPSKKGAKMIYPACVRSDKLPWTALSQETREAMLFMPLHPHTNSLPMCKLSILHYAHHCRAAFLYHHNFPCVLYAMQGFLSGVPRAIAALLRSAPIIPALDGSWVQPTRALVLTSINPMGPATDIPYLSASLHAVSTPVTAASHPVTGPALSAPQPGPTAQVQAAWESMAATAAAAAGRGHGAAAAQQPPLVTALSRLLQEGGAAALQRVLGLGLAHPGMTCLAASPALRVGLGCRELSAGTLVELAKVQARCEEARILYMLDHCACVSSPLFCNFCTEWPCLVGHSVHCPP